MRSVAVAFLGVAIFAITSAARGQPIDATIDELIARAIVDNPDLRAARAEIDAAAARVGQAALRPNPTLELGGQKAISSDNNLTVGVTLPLDLNGRKEGRIGVAERELAVKRALLADRERRLRADIRSKAGELLAARRNLAVADELLQANRDALTLVRRRVAEGAAPSLEENLTLVEVNRLEANRHLLASRLEVALLALKAYTGLPADSTLVVRGDLSAPPTVPE